MAPVENRSAGGGQRFLHRLVYHGREICTARTKPHCDRCCLSDICAKNGVES